MASGYSVDEEAGQILADGARAFIQKPFSMATLSLKIVEALQPCDDSTPVTLLAGVGREVG
ncbi:MAG: hypothetical protein ACYTGH_06450 [Planctomycetota bacterium]